uniref:Cytochrome P450 n=1 Tax=Narcissus tazetta TaxID=54860 RepID=M9T855_NARTA|nr:cytochrome P450 [Narcissus tazetta]
MDLLPWILDLPILVATITTIIIILKLTNRRRRLNLPPGPKPYPIMGNLTQIGPIAHRSIHDLSLKYGPIMQLKFGSRPIVVGSSVEAARFFLKTHDVIFASRPESAAGKYTAYDYSDITFSPYGPYLRQIRKICLVELFSPRRLDSLEYIRVEEIRLLMQDLFRSSGERVAVKDCMSTLGMNVISRMVLGKKYLGEEGEELKGMIDEWFALTAAFNPGDLFPWLGFFDWRGVVKKMKALSKRFHRFWDRVLDEHNERRKEEGERFEAKDMVDVLLQIADDPGLEVKLTRDSVKAFTQDLIGGGTETSATTIEWATAELVKHPEIIEKATEELDRVVGKTRWVEEKDIQSLPYLESVIKETMRLHPVLPLLIPRLAREDSTYEGYDIPAGTRVFVNVWSIGRDPSMWDDPEEFRPERFIGKEISLKGQNYELLPFGAGRRMCPGYPLGLREIQMSLANLLHGFVWKLPDGMTEEELNMEEGFGLATPRKVPLEVVLEPRLEAELYA